MWLYYIIDINQYLVSVGWTDVDGMLWKYFSPHSERINYIQAVILTAFYLPIDGTQHIKIKTSWELMLWSHV